MYKYKVDVFSKGRNVDLNEDSFGFNESCAVVCDGATSKGEEKFKGKTGGELISATLVDSVLDSTAHGEKLVEVINESVQNLYQSLSITPERNTDSLFTASFVSVRKIRDSLVITQLGDCGYRVNCGTICIGESMHDRLVSELRARYVELTGDTKSCRDFILPLLKYQHRYLNSETSELGYGAIDGLYTPSKYIKVEWYKLEEVETVELFTDGYPLVPDDASITSYENAYESVDVQDPFRVETFKSTKMVDDRTIVILSHAQC